MSEPSQIGRRTC